MRYRLYIIALLGLGITACSPPAPQVTSMGIDGSVHPPDPGLNDMDVDQQQ